MTKSLENEVIRLKKSYSSIYGAPIIDRVDTTIFKTRYYHACLSCGFCNDICCSYGVDIDVENVSRIMEHAESIENYTKIPQKEWFLPGYNEDKDFPGGLYTRTATKDGACIFLNHNGRGCLLHKFCIENNIDAHVIKPMVSFLFPITFDNGLLSPSSEIVDKSLVCIDVGITLYKSIRDELTYYFGKEFIEELDKISAEIE